MYGLVVWISWIDDCFVVEDPRAVYAAKEQMKSIFECDDLGELNEYVGCKIDRGEYFVKFTQPVLIQSYEDEDEFDLNKTRSVFTPAEQGKVLMTCDQGMELVGKEQANYCSRVGKLLHMMKWSRPEIYDAVRELSRFMKNMKRVMEYCVEMKEHGLLLKPDVMWDRNPEFQFVISGISDSDFAKDPETRKRVSGNSTFLYGSPIIQRSTLHIIMALLVTEALFAATNNAYDMSYSNIIVESLGLHVQMPMILEVEKKRQGDLDMWKQDSIS
jgi:hypothetical protein